MEKNKVETIKKILRIVSDVLLVILFIFCLLLLLLTVTMRSENASSQFFKYEMRYVLTGSMEPEIRQGDLIVIERVPEEDAQSYYASLKEEDIITFYWYDSANLEERVITHRITKVQPTGDGNYVYTTQGDAVEEDTQIVYSSEDKIIGKVVWKSHFIGLIMTIMRSPWGIVCCIIIPAALMIVYEVIKIINVFRNEKEEKRKMELNEKDAELQRLKEELEKMKQGEKEN